MTTDSNVDAPGNPPKKAAKAKANKPTNLSTVSGPSNTGDLNSSNTLHDDEVPPPNILNKPLRLLIVTHFQTVHVTNIQVNQMSLVPNAPLHKFKQL